MPMQPRVRHMRRLRWHAQRFGPHTRRFERTRDCGGLPRHSAAPRAECSSVPGPPLPCPLRPPSRVCVRACVGFSVLSPVYNVSALVACFGNKPIFFFHGTVTFISTKTPLQFVCTTASSTHQSCLPAIVIPPAARISLVRLVRLS